VLEPIFHELNRTHFESKLPLPLLSWNSRLRATAGRFCPGSRNLLRQRRPHIEVAAYLRELSDGAEHIRDTILHEMIHYFLWHEKKPYGHTEEFHAIMKRVGAKRYNPVPKLRPVKHWYQCPACFVKVPARRKLGAVACASCCKKHNGGYFSKRFLLTTNIEAQKIETTNSSPLHADEIIRRLEELKSFLIKSKKQAF
jgi:predicted SprT family Zn-dependent metalloprotease